MSEYSLSDATVRARAAFKDASVLTIIVNDAVMRGERIDDETASELLAMLQFICEQSNDTIRRS